MLVRVLNVVDQSIQIGVVPCKGKRVDSEAKTGVDQHIFNDRVLRARIDSLSDGQKACLRLVHGHLSSKEIARELGISRHTADQRIALACQKLGVASRRDAAILLAQYDPFIYERSHIAFQLGIKPIALDVSEETERGFEAGETEFSDVQLSAADKIVEVQSFPLPFPRRKGDRNDLSIVARLSWTLVIFVTAVLVSGALIAALEVLGRILE